MTIDFDNFDEEVLDQATAWIARLRSDQVTDDDKQQFALWLAESDQHKAAFDEMLLLWQSLKGTENISAPGTTTLQTLLSNTTVLPASNDELSSSAQAVSNDDRPTGNQKVVEPTAVRPRFPVINVENWAVAAAACLAIVAVLVFNGLQPKPTQTSFYSIYQTQIGEQKLVTLPDGSQLELNTQSRVEVSYNESQRHLYLEVGEAYFVVTPNKSKPFVVDAGAGRITAVGTAFNIYRQGRNTLVAVTEGTVDVADSLNLSAKTSNSARVRQGQSIVVDASTGLAEVEQMKADQPIAWRRQTLVFNETQLIDALAELNRYLLEPVDYSHPSLSKLKVSGTFSLKEPETTLTAIIDSFSLQVKRDANSEQMILLAPTPI